MKCLEASSGLLHFLPRISTTVVYRRLLHQKYCIRSGLPRLSEQSKSKNLVFTIKAGCFILFYHSVIFFIRACPDFFTCIIVTLRLTYYLL